MNEPHAEHDELEAWIDRRLTGARARDFEARLASDPKLAREAELARRIDGVLKQHFAAPELPQAFGRAAELTPALDPARAEARALAGRARAVASTEPDSAVEELARPARRFLALVGVLLGTAAALWLVLRIDFAELPPGPAEPSPQQVATRLPSMTPIAQAAPLESAQVRAEESRLHASVGPLVDADLGVLLTRVASPDLETLYSEATAWASDRSLSVCRPGTDLEGAFEASYGEGVELLPAAEGRLQGPFASAEWPTGMILAGYSEDAPAVLVAERDSTLTCCLNLELPVDSHLKVFTWRVGDLLLTEITPSAEPRLLDYFGEVF